MLTRPVDASPVKRTLAGTARALGDAAVVLVVDPDPPEPAFALSRRARRTSLAVAIAWGALWLGIGTAEMVDRGVLGGVAFLLALVHGLGVVVAARRPLLGWRLLLAGAVLRVAALDPSMELRPLASWQLACAVAVLLAVGFRHAGVPRTLVAVGLVDLVVVSMAHAAGAEPIEDVAWIVVSASLLAGAAAASRLRTRSELADARDLTDRAREERARLAERARIAREMHDVVAHHLSLVVVRCESAPYRLPGMSGEVARELSELSETARSAVTEMQSLLGVLRSEDHAPHHAPQPGLDDLDDLVAVGRASGMSITLRRDGPDGRRDRSVPAAVALSAYRIVQEGVTNAARHAPGAAVAITLGRDAAALEVTVVNGPASRAPDPGPPGGRAGGNGLPGMRERARLHGGTLDAAPLPDGGFRVRACLPAGAPR